MENKLQRMFDYQSFAGNARIEKMMKEAEARYNREISDDDLGMVNAAGLPGVTSFSPRGQVENNETSSSL